MYRNCK